jgi:membrane protein DedA with SNARE-associated domain
MHEEDLRWVANTALGAAFLFMLAGIALGQYFGDQGRAYITIASLFVSGIFAGFGLVIHWHVKKKIRNTTITRPGGWK